MLKLFIRALGNSQSLSEIPACLPQPTAECQIAFCRNRVCLSGSVEDMIRRAPYVQNSRVVLVNSTSHGLSPLLGNAANPREPEVKH
jgi:hypothetical protein